MTRQKKQSSEAAVREIRRRTRRKFSPEEKIRIVLEGLRGEQSVSEQRSPWSQTEESGAIAPTALRSETH